MLLGYMGLRSLYIFNSFSAGIDFRRYNLTSIKSVPALKGLMEVYQIIMYWYLHLFVILFSRLNELFFFYGGSYLEKNIDTAVGVGFKQNTLKLMK